MMMKKKKKKLDDDDYYSDYSDSSDCLILSLSLSLRWLIVLCVKSAVEERETKTW